METQTGTDYPQLFKKLGITDKEEAKAQVMAADKIMWEGLIDLQHGYSVRCTAAGVPGVLAFAVYDNALREAVAIHDEIIQGDEEVA